MTVRDLLAIINLLAVAWFAYQVGREEERGNSPVFSRLVLVVNAIAVLVVMLR